MRDDMVLLASAPGAERVFSDIAKLREEHRTLEARLDQLNRRLYLTAEEQVVKKDIQKLKLRTKDRIFALERKIGRA